jgi:POTRA domain-containing FtsQ-type protein
MPVPPRIDPKNRQIVTPRPSRRVAARPRRRDGQAMRKLAKGAVPLAKPIAFLAAVVLVMIGYNVVARSRVFQLHDVTVVGGSDSVRPEIERSVRKMVNASGLLDVDLLAIRQRIEAMPRVRSALVARVLPDGLFVKVSERKPAVVVRRGLGTMVWLDEDAVEMGEYSELITEGSADAPPQVPPVAKGFVEGSRSQAAITEDRERISIYKQIERDFSAGPNPIWNIIDEIDLTFTRDVSLRLAHPSIIIHLGSTDFRPRFEKALQVLHAAKQGDSEMLSRYRVQDTTRLIQNTDNINYIDAAKPERGIVVNLATPGATKKATKQEKNN